MIDSSEVKDGQGTRRQATKQEAVGPWVTLFTTYMNVFMVEGAMGGRVAQQGFGCRRRD